jgi:transposase
MMTVENWAEIRRLHRSEQIPIKEIVRRLGIARNTVRAALASDRPPKYERSSRGSVVDAVETDVRKLLADFPRMPATVIAERIGWEYSITTLKERIRQIRPEYAGLDPADRIIYRPGEIVRCDLSFPAPRIPVGHGQNLMLPVLGMTLGFSRFLTATMLPSRQAGDLPAGMWQLINALGKVPNVVTVPAASFAGPLATRIQLAPPRDPEFKGLVERNNGYFETSFLPGRTFASPAQFNTQLAGWLPKSNGRLVRSTGRRPDEALDAELAVMTALPSVPPTTGLRTRIELARDYYVRRHRLLRRCPRHRNDGHSDLPGRCRRRPRTVLGQAGRYHRSGPRGRGENSPQRLRPGASSAETRETAPCRGAPDDVAGVVGL